MPDIEVVIERLKLVEGADHLSNTDVAAQARRVIEELDERLKRAEAVINQAMREEAKTQRIMTGRLPTAEASSATWRVLATYKNGPSQ